MQKRHVEILAFPDVQLLDVAGPLQVFATANDISEKSTGQRPYAPVVVSTQANVPTSSGLCISAAKLASGRSLDTLIIAGGPGSDRAATDPQVRKWIIRRAKLARRVTSVCTGAFIVAEAGLLDGLRATTHWAYCEELARRFPNVRVERDPIFVKDGRIWTSAGVTAGIDLALALVEQDLGRQIAVAVARYLVVFLKRPGGQAQFSAALPLESENDDAFGQLHSWVLANLAGDLSLPALAAKCRMSERSFSRRYLAATGKTPAKGIEVLRVDVARSLLLDTDLPMKRVAQRCGFRNEETMRRSFIRTIGVPPSLARARFGIELLKS